MNYKLGKLPARKDAIKFKLLAFQSTIKYPKSHTHEKLEAKDWGMLGNDQYGDCVWAGAGHETMLWNREAGVTVYFTPQSVLTDYSQCTGFDPKKPNTDQGTDMEVAANYRLKNGVHDAKGHRHNIAAYLDVSPGDVEMIKMAIYQFGAVGIGIQFPNTAMDQFNENKNWTVVKGATIEGGHYVPAIGYDADYVHLVSWGRVVKASWAFIKKYQDEGIVYLTEEMFHLDKSLEGFDFATLEKDLKALYH